MFVCALGVTVLKGQEEIEVHAPVVISNAGIFNTFQKFLPKPIQEKTGSAMCKGQPINFKLHFLSIFFFFLLDVSCNMFVEIQSLLGMVRHGMGSFLVFVGLDGSKEELGIVSTNFWMYKDNDLNPL